jgi:GT2 family glycosyltransferase
MTDTAILIINWNNAADTILCLKSALGMERARIFLLDNDSVDDSVDAIIAFLRSENIRFPVINAPFDTVKPQENSKLTLIRSSRNLGFSGGNNLMLRMIRQQENLRYAWLLNNDAIADKRALDALILKMERHPSCAFAGSSTLDYYKPNLVQCCGVRYHKFFGVSKLQFKNAVWDKLSPGEIEGNHSDYQNGASLLVRMDALTSIGLMDERFFLYSEEHDWQVRGREKGYENLIAADSIVYHKGSVSTSGMKHMFYFQYNKSAVFFSRKHHWLPVNIVATIMLLLITAVRSKMSFKSMRWGIYGLMQGWAQSRK